MSKAKFYRIPVKDKAAYAPRRRQRSLEPGRDVEARTADRAPQARAAYHPAPQFRRNRRFWLRRLGLDKETR